MPNTSAIQLIAPHGRRSPGMAVTAPMNNTSARLKCGIFLANDMDEPLASPCQVLSIGSGHNTAVGAICVYNVMGR
jgi:hypothetical protein